MEILQREWKVESNISGQAVYDGLPQGRGFSIATQNSTSKTDTAKQTQYMQEIVEDLLFCAKNM